MKRRAAGGGGEASFRNEFKFDVGQSGVVDQLGVDQEPELRDAVGQTGRGAGVVRIRVDGDGGAPERRQRRLGRGALVIEPARGDDDQLGPVRTDRLP